LKVSEVPQGELRHRLQRGDLVLQMNPFVVRIQSDIPDVVCNISQMYESFSLLDCETFADFHVAVLREKGLRRWLLPQVRFYFDGRPSFVPLPIHQAFPMLEWGINWCVAAHCHQYLIIHAAVIEKGGKAIVLPAPPGSGKSTLCAALVNRGWRLLSDELGLYDMGSGMIYGMSRPINLKNKSIEIIKNHTPSVEMTAAVPNTTKGTVALLKPPFGSVERIAEAAIPAWVVLPEFQTGAEAVLEPYSKARASLLIADQSFNYNVQGRAGFDAVGDILERCDCYKLTYSRLEDAERIFAGLFAESADCE
jgi:HprK-related kinase A